MFQLEIPLQICMPRRSYILSFLYIWVNTVRAAEGRVVRDTTNEAKIYENRLFLFNSRTGYACEFKELPNFANCMSSLQFIWKKNNYWLDILKNENKTNSELPNFRIEMKLRQLFNNVLSFMNQLILSNIVWKQPTSFTWNLSVEWFLIGKFVVCCCYCIKIYVFFCQNSSIVTF